MNKKNKKPKWAMSVPKAMLKSCPKNCQFKSSGKEFDKHGTIIRTFSCKDYCRYIRS